MSTHNPDLKSALRIDLLKVVDEIQSISVKYRTLGIDQKYATEINELHIKVSELIGKLWVEK